MTSAELRQNPEFWESKIESKIEIEIVSLLLFLTPPISLGRETRENLRKKNLMFVVLHVCKRETGDRCQLVINI